MYTGLIKPQVLVLVPVLILLFLAAACGAEATPHPTATPQPTPTPIDVGSIVSKAVEEALAAQPTLDLSRVALAARYGTVIPGTTISNPNFVDPHEGFGLQDAIASSPMYNQLVEYNPINPTEIIGDLAKSWSLSDDGKTYTFVLHDAKWWDGKDVTAEDAAFSIMRIIDPEETNRPKSGTLRPYVDSAEAVDKSTLTITLKFPAGAFLPLLAVDYMKIVPKHVAGEGVDIGIFGNVVGSGPFKFVSFTPGSNFEFEKNPDYFKEGLPYFDGIKAFIITDTGTEIAAFKTERVLMNLIGPNQLTPEDVTRLENDPNFINRYDIWLLHGSDNKHILLNVNQAPFDNEKVRRAFFLALDRGTLVEGFGGGTYRPGGLMSPSNLLALPEGELLQLPGFRTLDGKKHPDDIAEARKLLGEAGYPDGKGFKAVFVTPIVQVHPQYAQAIKVQLEKDLGIELEVRPLELSGWVTQMIDGTYQMSSSGYGTMVADPDDKFQNVYTDTPRNWARWTDPKVAELFDQQQRETDPDKRREIALEMQRVVYNGSPGTLDWAWSPFPMVVSNRIKTEAGHYVVTSSVQTILKHEHEWLSRE